jgi:hypothetical protein
VQRRSTADRRVRAARPARCVATGVVAAAGALVLAGVALSANGDPKRHLNAADQRFAQSIRIRRADLRGSSWQARRPRAGFGGKGCRRPSESDLVLTGDAKDREFVRPGALVASQASVYASAAQASAAWQRGLRRRVFTCLRGTLARIFTAPGARITVRGTARLHESGHSLLAAGYRVFFGLRGPQGSFRGRLGYYRLTRGRAVAILLVMTFTRPVEPVTIPEEKHLLGLVTDRSRR